MMHMQALFAAAESDGFGLASLWPALIWLGVLILALVVEGLTTDLGAICFVPGALVAMILAVFEVHGAIQIAVCIAISVTLMILVKTVFKKFLRKSGDAVDTSVDSLTGRLAMVKEEINNNAETGVVMVNGQLWSARMVEDEVAPVGTRVEIVQVQGTKLICKRAG